jgi:hypothetical protein
VIECGVKIPLECVYRFEIVYQVQVYQLQQSMN